MDIGRLEQVGVVRSDVSEPADMPHGGVPAVIEVFPQFAPALDRLEEHSHAWILMWFHRAERDRLHIKPSRVDPDAAPFGVFGLRAFSRPNPIGLTLVDLLEIDRDTADGSALVRVPRLDAIDGTPVLDIKPYFENDTVFSPRTPYLRPKRPEDRRWLLYRHALQHHLEDCDQLRLAVRMAMIAEARFGHLNEPDLLVTVQGDPHVADVLQGVTRARLAHPPRFSYLGENAATQATFTRASVTVSVTPRFGTADWFDLDIPDEDLFEIVG